MEAFDKMMVLENLKRSITKEDQMPQEIKRACIETLDELRADQDVNGILKAFEDGLEGERNMLTIGEGH